MRACVMQRAHRANRNQRARCMDTVRNARGRRGTCAKEWESQTRCAPGQAWGFSFSGARLYPARRGCFRFGGGAGGVGDRADEGVGGFGALAPQR